MQENQKISAKNWTLIVLLGIAGQLCWSVEGSWFNNFVYDRIAQNPSIVAWMVAVSATTSTIATFLIGTWGDRAGKRRPFIAAGYILWGLFTFLYGVTEFLPKSSLLLAATAVVAADGIMSFFGSFGFHAGFNPWTTDISNESNRGRVGAIIAAVPIIASILSGVSGSIIEKIDFYGFFTLIGALVAAIGVLSLIILRDAPTLVPKRDEKGFWHQLVQIFSWKTIRENKELFFVFLYIVLFNIAFNVYFPYISIYLVNYIGLSYSLTGIVQAASLLLAVFFTIPAARFIDRGKVSKVLLGAILINIVGLVVVFAAGKASLPLLCFGIFATGLGYVLNTQTLSAWVKNLLPEGSFGQFEGIRMLFAVCIPMIIGPGIATGIINAFGVPTLTNGVAGVIPSNALFGFAALLMLTVFVPLVILIHRRKAAAK